MCSSPAFALPPTVLVPVSSIVYDAYTTAEKVMSTLVGLGMPPPTHASQQPPSVDSNAPPQPWGIAKLGYSWEALDVRAFSGTSESLAAALKALVLQDGFFGDCVLVQRFVPALCELRLFVVDGR